MTREAVADPAIPLPPDSGGVVDFRGVVRGTENGAPISGILYEAHEQMAEAQMRRIAHECSERFPLTAVILHHRIGYVPAGETSLLVRTCSRHRGPAFEAAEWIVVELKKRVPIWKHPREKAARLDAADAPRSDDSSLARMHR